MASASTVLMTVALISGCDLTLGAPAPYGGGPAYSSVVQASLPGVQYSYQLGPSSPAQGQVQQVMQQQQQAGPSIILKSVASSSSDENWLHEGQQQQVAVAAAQQQGSSGTYQGPKVTKEETERLHASAIEAQNKIIAQQKALIASNAGPARPQQQQQQQHGSRPVPVPASPGGLVVIRPAVSYQVPTPSGAVVSSASQAQQQVQAGAASGGYTGPKVTEEETEKLHAVAIAERAKLIAAQAALNAAGPAKAVLAVSQQISRPSVTYEVPGTSGKYPAPAPSPAAVQHPTAAAAAADCQQLGEAAAQVKPAGPGPIVLVPAKPAASATYQVPITSGPYVQHQQVAVSGSGSQHAQQSSTSAAQVLLVSGGGGGGGGYTGPKVTKEETEKLHADAIAKRDELIAQLAAISQAGPATGNNNNKPAAHETDSSSSSSSSEEDDSAGGQALIPAAPARPVTAGTATQILVPVPPAVYGPPAQQLLTAQHQQQSTSSQQINTQQGGLQAVVAGSGPGPGSQLSIAVQPGSITQQAATSVLPQSSNLVQVLASSSSQAAAAAAAAAAGGSSSSGGSGSFSSTYKGEIVSKEETERLHEPAIRQLQAQINQLHSLINGNRQTVVQVQQQQQQQHSQGSQALLLDEDARAELALLQAQDAEVERQNQVAIEQGNQAAALADDGSGGDEGTSAVGQQAGIISPHQSQQLSTVAAVPSAVRVTTIQQSAPSVWRQQSASSHQQVLGSTVTLRDGQQQQKWTGPIVTKEETERLHADAIRTQNQIIASFADSLAGGAAGRQSGSSSASDEASGQQQTSSVNRQRTAIGPSLQTFIESSAGGHQSLLLSGGSQQTAGSASASGGRSAAVWQTSAAAAAGPSSFSFGTAGNGGTGAALIPVGFNLLGPLPANVIRLVPVPLAGGLPAGTTSFVNPAAAAESQGLLRDSTRVFFLRNSNSIATHDEATGAAGAGVGGEDEELARQAEEVRRQTLEAIADGQRAADDGAEAGGGAGDGSSSPLDEN